MDFVNRTAFPAKVFRAQLLYKNLLMATVVASTGPPRSDWNAANTRHIQKTVTRFMPVM